MMPGAIRCERGHNHIYFPRDFGFVDLAVIVPDAIMQENREAYRAINPRPSTFYTRPAAKDDEPLTNRHNHVPRTVVTSGEARHPTSGTYRLSAKPYLTAEGEFKGHLEGVLFTATSSTRVRQWFAISCGQLEKDFRALVPQELAVEMMAALNQGADINFPDSFQQEQLDRSFHYEGSPVHFILCASKWASKN